MTTGERGRGVRPPERASGWPGSLLIAWLTASVCGLWATAILDRRPPLGQFTNPAEGGAGKIGQMTLRLSIRTSIPELMHADLRRDSVRSRAQPNGASGKIRRARELGEAATPRPPPSASRA